MNYLAVDAACHEPLTELFLSFGLAGMTKVEQAKLGEHVRGCEFCQDVVGLELKPIDPISQLLELRRRMA